MLYSLTGEAPNGLLLTGDGQQAVYPGGFRLSDAGIDIRGDRSQVLRVNYRNRKEILDAALDVVADHSFEDIDGLRTPGRRDVDLTYHDGQVVRVVRPDTAEHDRALVADLRTLTPGERADSAVLCPSKKAITHYQSVPSRADVPVCALEQYDSNPVDAVKLGTCHRAKGLEFKRVYLPRYDAGAPVRPGGAPSGADAEARGTVREREELYRSQLFVAMTRARDVLWLGAVRGGQGCEE
nr:3'-5' exonuclease [Streptomyces boncukensis]